MQVLRPSALRRSSGCLHTFAGQATVSRKAGNFVEVVWICQLGLAACMMQQLNACANDIRCLTLHELILPGQESGSGLPACVHALINDLPVPGLEIVLGNHLSGTCMGEVHCQPIRCLSCAVVHGQACWQSPHSTWAVLCKNTCSGSGTPSVGNSLRRLSATISCDHQSTLPGPAGALEAAPAACRGDMSQHQDMRGSTLGCQCWADCCRAVWQAESACTYMASHVHPRMPWVPCTCCTELWENEPAQELLQAVSGMERIIDAARTRSEPQA